MYIQIATYIFFHLHDYAHWPYLKDFLLHLHKCLMASQKKSVIYIFPCQKLLCINWPIEQSSRQSPSLPRFEFYSVGFRVYGRRCSSSFSSLSLAASWQCFWSFAKTREGREREQLEQRRRRKRRKRNVAFFLHSFFSSLVLCKITAGCAERG